MIFETFFVVTLSTCAAHVTTDAEIHDAILHALQTSKANVDGQKLLNEELHGKGVDMGPSRAVSHMRMLSLFGNFRKSLEPAGDQAAIIIGATQKLAHMFGGDIQGVLNNPLIAEHWPTMSAPFCSPRLPRCIPSKYRTIDGSCNNLKFPTWGMSGRGQKRYLPPHYQDGINIPRIKSFTGAPLPSPRLVSNVIHKPAIVDKVEPRFSAMFMQWGQLIDHDFVDTPMIKGFNGADITCCNLPKHLANSRDACFTIAIPFGDPVFKRHCMNFVRSVPASLDNCMPGPREQMNQATSYIDASYLYGTNDETATVLRAFKFGFLKMNKPGFFYPHEDQNNCMNEEPGDYCMKSGDERIHIVPGLASLQILMLREHNRIAATLGKINPHWNDEIIYQETRKIVAALNQQITYGEYLEPVIGPDMMNHFGLYIKPRGFNTVYKPEIDASVANSFAVAAFRFGHSQIPGNVNLFLKNATRIVYGVEHTFTRPSLVLADQGRGCDHVNRWLFNEPSGKMDRFLEPGVRDLMFLDNQGNSFDLSALNIQRGRDHGIPGYNAWRKWCSLPVAHSFEDLLDIEPDARLKFAKIYHHVNDIDLFSGGLSEIAVLDGVVGPTFACIIGRQFKDLKYGDRFWYENNFPDIGFTAAQLDSIKTQRLSNIICNNQPEYFVPLDAFSIPSLKKNPQVPCKTLPQINFWFWKDIPLGKDILAVRPPYGYMSKIVKW